jgi:hypothetical protein
MADSEVFDGALSHSDGVENCRGETEQCRRLIEVKFRRSLF